MQNEQVPGTCLFSISICCLLKYWNISVFLFAANPPALTREIVTPLLNLNNKIYQWEISACGGHQSKQDNVKHWGKNWRGIDNAPAFLTAVISHLELLPLMVFLLWWSLLIFFYEWHIVYLSLCQSVHQSINQLFLIGTKHPVSPHISSGIAMGTKLNWLKLELHDFLLALKCK